MGDYVLQISYGETRPPLRVELTGLSSEDAETKRQALVHELESGVDMHAPPVSLRELDSDLPDVSVDPAHVTDVALLDPADVMEE